MNPDKHIDALLAEAKSCEPPAPSVDLIARVLADAAEMAPKSAPAIPAATKPPFWVRLFSPVGGVGGAFALAACAAFGVFIGADYADTLLSIPGLDGVLAVFYDGTDSTSPFETLSLLMSES